MWHRLWWLAHHAPPGGWLAACIGRRMFRYLGGLIAVVRFEVRLDAADHSVRVRICARGSSHIRLPATKPDEGHGQSRLGPTGHTLQGGVLRHCWPAPAAFAATTSATTSTPTAAQRSAVSTSPAKRADLHVPSWMPGLSRRLDCTDGGVAVHGRQPSFER